MRFSALLSGGLLAASVAAQDEKIDMKEIEAKWRFYGYHNCNSKEVKQVTGALSDKHTITGVDSSQKINWNGAGAIDFFGSAMRVKAYRDKIQQNLKNAYKFGDGWWGSWKNTQIFCHDNSIEGDDRKGDCKKSQGIHIWVYKNYKDGHDAFMVCDSFFKLPSLNEALKNGKASSNPLDLTNYDNRAIAMVTALLQKDDIGTWPKMKNEKTNFLYHRRYDYGGQTGVGYITTPSAIKWVAKDRDNWNIAKGKTLWGNVDTYAWFSMAGWLLEHRQLDAYPAYPFVPRDLQVSESKITEEDKKEEEEALKAAELD